jgi:hypothetical protein
VGVDENAVFTVEDGRIGTVLGDYTVMVLTAPDGAIELFPGQKYDLIDRKVIK